MIKHVVLLLISVITGLTINSQTSNPNAQWDVHGNNATGSEYIGTNNTQPLIFKTNGIERGRIGGGGEFLIGTTNPIANYMMRVGGSAHVDRSLFVQEYITYMKSLKGPRVDVDTIKMDSTRGIYGTTKVFGDVQISQDLSVNGKTLLNGEVRLNNKLSFNNVSGVQFYNTGTRTEVAFGKIVSGQVLPAPSSTCLGQQNSQFFTFNGLIQSWGNNANGGQPNSMTMGFDGANSIIETEGTSNSNTAPRLLINYHCGKDVFICTGPNGGVLHANKTHLGPSKPIAGTAHDDAMLSVFGKIVAKSCYITIDNWMDKVFADDYKLMPLSEVENFYRTNKHLPNIPAEKEVIENGANLGELSKLYLQKIEELTIYVVEQQKEIDSYKEQLQKTNEQIELLREMIKEIKSK